MANGIVLSNAIRTNLLALQGTAETQAKVQERLATGKKVNSALDNATNYFTAGAFNTRAADLTRLLDGMSNAVQTIKTANAGIESIKKLVDNLQAISRQALGAPSPFTQRASLTSPTAIPNATAADLRGNTYSSVAVTGAVRQSGAVNIVDATVVNSFDGAGNTIVAGDTLTINGQTITFVSGAPANANEFQVTDTVANLRAKITALTGLTTGIAGGQLTINTGTASDLTITGSATTKLGFTVGTTARTSTVGTLDGQSLVLTVGSGATAVTKTIVFGDGTGSSVKTLDQLNAQLDSLGLTASIDSTGKLTIATTNRTAARNFNAAGNGAGTLFGSTNISTTNLTRGGVGAEQRDSYITDFNNLLTQIDQLAGDAGFNGINLLNGDDLSVIFNEYNTAKLDIKGVRFDSAGLSLMTITTVDFDDADGINAVLGKLDTAQAALRSQASRLGSNYSVVQMRQEFSKQLVNTLEVGADNLTLADTNEEGANLLALNTRQQLSQTALSLAAQAQQAVLRLFG
jgi:flagellin-like hook-associated protein FlgL